MNARSSERPIVRILGTRGVPGRHGGFESFAEQLACHLVAHGWSVTVYCQRQGRGATTESEWRGIRLITISVPQATSWGSVVFDWHATRHAAREEGLVLVLGYNTALFSAMYRARGLTSLMNMDGFEWRRQKYGLMSRAWFYVNEWLGCWLSNALVADHPEIMRHLRSRRYAASVAMVPYGARAVVEADRRVLEPLGVAAGRFALVIARPEPENSILEIVRAFSSRTRGLRLMVLGAYSRAVPYQRAVLDAAGAEVSFPGAVYEADLVDALRLHAELYVHGHQVGGTNPSLVEAMGAGAAILAHDNRFNRWVAGNAACYFGDEAECGRLLDQLCGNTDTLAALRAQARARHQAAFALTDRLEEYEQLLARVAGTSAATDRASATHAPTPGRGHAGVNTYR